MEKRGSENNRFRDSNNMTKSSKEVMQEDTKQETSNNEMQKENEVKLDIDSLFSKKKKEKSRNHTFYLKEENYRKIEKIAKDRGFSISEVLNRILDQF